MEVTIFAKSHTTKEGKKFYTFCTTLTAKDGTKYYTTVKFREGCSISANDCPKNIIIKKENANFTHKKHINKDSGKEYTEHILWISAFENGSEWVDTSMDEFF
jgi:hypothetical protein